MGLFLIGAVAVGISAILGFIDGIDSLCEAEKEKIRKGSRKYEEKRNELLNCISQINNSIEAQKTAFQTQRYHQEVYHHQNIQTQVNQAIEEANFSVLVQLHHDSAKRGHEAYKHLKEVETELKSSNAILFNFTVQLKGEVDKLFTLKSSVRTKSEKIELQNAIQTSLATKNKLWENINRNKATLVELKNVLDQFNSTTRGLKFHIRDNFGNGGITWFNRLQQRSDQRRLQT